MADISTRKVHFYVSAKEREIELEVPETNTDEQTQIEFDAWLVNHLDAGWSYTN